ncbi:hypothetical protein [Edaphobacter aggregans]|uniref:hypothetical protein n=1 Tax=Edaphobacter aggregans TaxID=570835 RepID=UPI0005519B82|nr:hypothetical protein [Edaphobacter aggregans]
MKSKILFAAAMVFAVPALAFAASKNSANVSLVNVAGTQLAPGQYKLSWEGTGPDVTVVFTEGKKTIATTSAKLVSNRNNQEAIETTTAGDNKSVLQAVDLKNLTLQFENAVPAAGN